VRLTLRQAERDDPEMRKISYLRPVEPWLRYLPVTCSGLHYDELDGTRCEVIETDYESAAQPRAGEVRIHEVWLDNYDRRILKLQGEIFLQSSPHSLLSHDFELDVTDFVTVQRGGRAALMPAETISYIDGAEDQLTTYWYNADLPFGLFRLNSLAEIHTCPPRRPVVEVIGVPSPRYPIPRPHPGPHPRPIPTPQPVPDPKPRPPRRPPHPEPQTPPPDTELTPPVTPLPTPKPEPDHKTKPAPAPLEQKQQPPPPKKDDIHKKAE
jgi:hypothetical protein